MRSRQHGWQHLDPYRSRLAYHAAKQFGQEDVIKEYVDEYYPYVCTCTSDVENIKDQLQQAEDAGVEVNANKGMFSSCSEDAMGIATKSSWSSSDAQASESRTLLWGFSLTYKYILNYKS